MTKGDLIKQIMTTNFEGGIEGFFVIQKPLTEQQANSLQSIIKAFMDQV